MKLDLYNKRLLATIGTALVVMALLGVFSMAYFLFEEVSRGLFDNDGEEHQQLVVDSTAAIPQKIRVVNTGYPEIIDSAKGVYLIPLGQLSVDEADIDLLNSFGSGGYSKSYGYRSQTFNNLLLFNETTGSVEPIYTEKLLITDYELTALDSLQVLIIKLVTTDTDGDGLLTKRDNKVLDIFYLDTKTTDRLFEDGLIYLSNRKSASWKELHIMFYKDINQNGQVDKNIDPIVARRYIPGKGLREIVPEALLKEVQKTIN